MIITQEFRIEMEEFKADVIDRLAKLEEEFNLTQGKET